MIRGMNKVFGLLFAAAALLSACAPAVTGPVLGRIVNNATGAEGQVSIVRGSLERAGGVNASDNVMITLGRQVFTGRTVLVDTGVATSARSVGGYWNSGFWGPFGWDNRPLSVHSEVVSRSGNLIARTAGPRPVTLTCTLLVSTDEHGTGDCQSSDKLRYTMQF